MAEGKKSALIYCDIIHTVEELDDVDAGLLFKHFLRYVNDLNPEPPSKLIKIVFEPIKQSLKRDLKKWQAISNKNRDNANKRWEKENATASDRMPTDAKNADRDIDRDRVKDIVIVKGSTSINIKPDENFVLDLPEIKINAAIEYISITKNTKADRNLILSLWTIFKQKNFTGENFYPSKSKIFSHFFESLKFEKINGTHQRTPAGVKSNPKTAGFTKLRNNLEEQLRGTGQEDY